MNEACESRRFKEKWQQRSHLESNDKFQINEATLFGKGNDHKTYWRQVCQREIINDVHKELEKNGLYRKVLQGIIIGRDPLVSHVV